MPTYKFIYGYPKFYPAVQGADGRSLQANPGDEVDFDTPPNDGCWFPLPPRSDDPPETPAAGPEPAPEPPAPAPEPEPAPAVPEPAPAPVAPDGPVPVQPVQPQPFMFPGFRFPSARP